MRILNIKQASDYLKVSVETLRLWDRKNILIPSKTPGGHRRYSEEQLNKFLNLKNNKIDYGYFYETLCTAQHMAEYLDDPNLNEITIIKANVGNILLGIHNKKSKIS